MNSERRLKLAYLSEWEMMAWFKDGMFRVDRGVPSDAKIARIGYEMHRDALAIVFEHPSFPVVPPHMMIPRVEEDPVITYIGQGKQEQLMREGRVPKKPSRIGALAWAVISAAVTSAVWAAVQMLWHYYG